jgi:hypothetical protein
MSEILCHSGTHLDARMNYIVAIGAALDTSAYMKLHLCSTEVIRLCRNILN